MAKRPTALKYTSFYEQLPLEWQIYFHSCTTIEKSDALKLLATLMKDYDISRLTEALKMASEHGHPSVESIKQVFYQIVNGRGIREDLQIRKALPSMPSATRGLQHYDQLLKGAEEN